MHRAPLLFLAVLAACGDDTVSPDASTVDAGPPDAADRPPADAGPPPTCADGAEVAVFPTPMWVGADGRLQVPDGDRIAAALESRPSWIAQVSALTGFPRRPTVVVALVGEPDVEPEDVRFHDADGVDLERPAVVRALPAEPGGSPSLAITPLDPLPAELSEVIVSIAGDALPGSHVLPTCDASGEPHPAHAEAAAAVGGAEWAMRVPLSSVASELPALGAALSTAPALTVAEADAIDHADLGELAPTPDVAALLAPRAVDGVLELPAYQGADGRFVVEGGVPRAQGVSRVGFTVLLPATGEAPWPVVLYQHGGGQHRHGVAGMAGPLAEAGFALVAIDLPAHGERAPEGAEGGDLDILVFDDPLRTRDNLRQASADHLAVLTGLPALSDAVAAALGLEGPVFDPARAFYTGLSLGAITGSMTFVSATELRASALFVGGGGFGDIVSEGFFALLLSDALPGCCAIRGAVLALIATHLAGADPLSYAGLAPADRPALFFEAMMDPVVNNAATEQWARAFGASLVRPAQRPVDGMEEVDLPHTGEPTRALVQCPMADVATVARHGALLPADYTQDIVAHCFTGVRDGSGCEVIDSGFAAR